VGRFHLVLAAHFSLVCKKPFHWCSNGLVSVTYTVIWLQIRVPLLLE